MENDPLAMVGQSQCLCPIYITHRSLGMIPQFPHFNINIHYRTHLWLFLNLSLSLCHNLSNYYNHWRKQAKKLWSSNGSSWFLHTDHYFHSESESESDSGGWWVSESNVDEQWTCSHSSNGVRSSSLVLISLTHKLPSSYACTFLSGGTAGIIFSVTSMKFLSNKPVTTDSIIYIENKIWYKQWLINVWVSLQLMQWSQVVSLQ